MAFAREPPLRAVVRAASEPVTAAVAIAVALGLYLFQDGLSNIRNYLVRLEARRSHAPVPYNSAMPEWRAVVDSASARASWYLLALGARDGEAVCRELARLVPAGFATTLLLAQADAARAPDGSRRTCAVGRASMPLLERHPSSLPAGMTDSLGQGFVVMDSSFRVVYSSRRLAEARNLASVLALFALPEASGRGDSPIGKSNR